MKIQDLLLNDTSLPSKSILANDICARLYLSEIATDNWLVFIHGKGEIGPSDGSKLSLVEKNNGYPKFAKGIRPGAVSPVGVFEFPFNILALQYNSETGLQSDIYRCFADWFASRYKPRKWGLLGISMGSIRGQYEMLRWSEGSKNAPNFFVSICGTHSIPSWTRLDESGKSLASDVAEKNRCAYVGAFPDVPGQAWHGDKDTTVTMASHKTFVDYYNKTHENQIIWNPLSGVGHNAWDHAFKLPVEQNSLYKWIVAQFEAKTDYEVAVENTTMFIKGLRKLV
jgi:hypothetical protein